MAAPSSPWFQVPKLQLNSLPLPSQPLGPRSLLENLRGAKDAAIFVWVEWCQSMTFFNRVTMSHRISCLETPMSCSNVVKCLMRCSLFMVNRDALFSYHVCSSKRVQKQLAAPYSRFPVRFWCCLFCGTDEVVWLRHVATEPPVQTIGFSEKSSGSIRKVPF